MGLAQWLRLVDTVSGLAAASKQLRGGAQVDDVPPPSAGGALGQLEARLAGVVVAALKEAFDRDRARLDLEQSHIEAERARAAEVLRLELLRQAGDRALYQVRLTALMSLAVWITSAVLAIGVPGLGQAGARILLAGGWGALIAALACAFAAHAAVTAALALAHAGTGPPELPRIRALVVAPWLLVSGLALTAVSLFVAL
jgi:hypothetical protein